MNKSMLDLYKKVDLQEIKKLKRREKRNKWTRKWISPLSLLYFFSFSPASFTSILFFLSLRLYKKLLVYFIILKLQNSFVKAKLLAVVNCTFSFFETFIQKLVTHFHYFLVRECHVLQSLLQNCTCPYGQAGGTGCQPSIAAYRMKRPTRCRQWDVQVLVSVGQER